MFGAVCKRVFLIFFHTLTDIMISICSRLNCWCRVEKPVRSIDCSFSVHLNIKKTVSVFQMFVNFPWNNVEVYLRSIILEYESLKQSNILSLFNRQSAMKIFP